jgi:hypothetical protein
VTEPDTYRIPSDEELLRVYGQGTGSGDGSSYDGWLALYMFGFRDGALVRPNVESNATNFDEAWAEYAVGGQTTRADALAFQAGFAYGKRADVRIRPAWWVWPLSGALAVLAGTLGAAVVAVLR